MTWVLIETLSSKKRGHLVYFRYMTAIGPCSTWDRAEAMEFGSREEAARHPATQHVLTFYEPREVE